LAGLERSYGQLLHSSLGRRRWVVLAAVALLGAAVALIPLVGSEFLPQTDESEVRKLRGLPGMDIRVRAGQGLFLLQLVSGGGGRVQLEVRGHDPDTARRLAEEVKPLVEGTRGITDAQLSRVAGRPEEILRIDREAAADLGLSVQQISDALQTVLSGSQAGFFRQEGKEYTILVKVNDAEKLPRDELLGMTVTAADGRVIPLKSVVRTEPSRGPVLVERKRLLRGLRRRLRGAAEGVPRAALGLLLALVLVYMVMACQYESLRDPLVVMFSVPLAAIGVVFMLFLTGTTFNVQSYIGCIMLGGIVVNNAILLVDHTNLLRRRDGLAAARGHRGGRPAAAAADPDDRADDHARPAAAGLGPSARAARPRRPLAAGRDRRAGQPSCAGSRRRWWRRSSSRTGKPGSANRP
jgi:hydrophobic/amphiphilic exporter-1 (mainly G- bacteria), HAE1 family